MDKLPISPPPLPPSLHDQTAAPPASGRKRHSGEAGRAPAAHTGSTPWFARRTRLHRLLRRAAGALLVALACALGVWWATGQSGWPSTLPARLPDPSRIAAWLRKPDLAQLPGLPRHWNPWAPLTLQEHDGPLTRWKINRLQASPAACRQWLADAPAIASTPLPDRSFGTADQQAGGSTRDHCGWQTASRISGMGEAGFSSPFTITCGAAVALARWERHVLQPAARAHLGAPVVRIEHLGSYACRGIASSTGAGRLSEHAHANALDVAAFILADGRRVSVLTAWQAGAAPSAPATDAAASQSEGDASATQDSGHGKPKSFPFAMPAPATPVANPKAAFLRQVRDGACSSFAAVLGPDYNAAHHDHFHFDRGPYRVCR